MKESLLLVVCWCAVFGSALPDNASWTPGIEAERQREVTAELFLNNGVDWGVWGPADYCPEGSFAHAFEVKFELYSATDETAVNSVKLYCSTPAGHDTGYAVSTDGQYGQWMGMRICERGYLTSMRANVMQYQGVLHDDVGIENLEMECNYGDEVLVGVEDHQRTEFELGEWSRWAHCYAGSSICGIEVRYEEPYVGDDAGMTDLVMYCCNNATLTSVEEIEL